MANTTSVVFLYLRWMNRTVSQKRVLHIQKGKEIMKSEQILEFDKIKNKLKGYAYTDAAKEKIAALQMFLSENEVNAAQRDTSEARKILDVMGNPPLTALEGMEEIINVATHGGVLTEEQFEHVEMTLTTVRRLKDFLVRCKQLEISLPYYEENLDSMEDVREEINRIIRNGKVDDFASKTLKSIRSELERVEYKMREKADVVLRVNKEYLSDSFCVTRNGHICLPVKKSCKSKVDGSVIDQSATGNTLFIEPKSIAKFSGELQILQMEEDNEVRRILYTLTAMLADSEEIFIQNKHTIEKLDFIFAKGKLSVELDGTQPVMLSERRIIIRNGRHPLMEKNQCVPLNFSMGKMDNAVTGVIITGPNTGGKTVAIKTVGLNCIMAQCGLHVACQKAEICMNSQILCDIGDGQNINDNLSTFSAHIKNVLNILQKANQDSLVILDELGSGTDPTEGMGIAIAILEELRKCDALYLVTTHYPEVKKYAERTEGVINARMTFDRESLKPLYQLEIGAAGESCAFYIAKRLGMPGSMLKCASDAAYGSTLKSEAESTYGNEEMPPLKILFDEKEELQHAHAPKLVRKNTVRSQKIANQLVTAQSYQLGDSVMVLPDKKIGIVCETMNEKGVLRVQMPDKKIWINHKRVKLQVAANQLYPPDYDFSIIFESVADRKAKHLMERRYAPEVEIKKDKGEL